MKKLFKREGNLVPYYMVFPLALTLIANTVAYYGGRQITANMYHFNMTTIFDDMIPVIPWTIIIYWGCYLFWGINYIIGCRQNRQDAYRFISADFFAKWICLFIFIAMPTTNIRPDVIGTSIWDEGLKLLYKVDAADNLFPSIHCLTSWFCFIAVRKNDSIQKWYKVVSLLITIAICISTLTLKQHAIIDVVGGIGLAEFCYWFVRDTGFAYLYRRDIGSAQRKLLRLARQ